MQPSYLCDWKDDHFVVEYGPGCDHKERIGQTFKWPFNNIDDLVGMLRVEDGFKANGYGPFMLFSDMAKAVLKLMG